MRSKYKVNVEGEVEQVMKYDVVVIGAGPSGSMVARTVAESGANVLLMEKHPAIGTPVHCAEATWEGILKEVDIELDFRWVANRVRGGYYFTPRGEKVPYLMSNEGGLTGLMIERKIFDKSLALEAGRAGADIMMRTRAVGVIKENHFVRGIKAVREGEEFGVEANVVVAADGVESRVARWAGLNTAGKLSETMSCYQYEMVGVQFEEPDMLEFYFGRKLAPQGYAWIFPKGNDVANVGIGVRGVSERHAKAYLDQFIERSDRLSRAKIVEIRGGALPVDGPLDRFVQDGLVVVGTAAHLVDPFSGAGILSALRSGLIAGRVINAALEEGRHDAERLLEYQEIIMNRLGRRWRRNAYFRKVFDKMSDDDLDEFLKLFPEIGEVLYRGKGAEIGQKIKFIIRRAPKLAKLFKFLFVQLKNET